VEGEAKHQCRHFQSLSPVLELIPIKETDSETDKVCYVAACYTCIPIRYTSPAHRQLWSKKPNPAHKSKN